VVVGEAVANLTVSSIAEAADALDSATVRLDLLIQQSTDKTDILDTAIVQVEAAVGTIEIDAADDSLTVSDSAVVRLGSLAVGVTEGVAVSDASTVRLAQLTIQGTEGLTVSDLTDVRLNYVTVFATESLTISERRVISVAAAAGAKRMQLGLLRGVYHQRIV
jgi:hypothetical protein